MVGSNYHPRQLSAQGMDSPSLGLLEGLRQYHEGGYQDSSCLRQYFEGFTPAQVGFQAIYCGLYQASNHVFIRQWQSAVIEGGIFVSITDNRAFPLASVKLQARSLPFCVPDGASSLHGDLQCAPAAASLTWTLLKITRPGSPWDRYAPPDRVSRSVPGRYDRPLDRCR